LVTATVTGDQPWCGDHIVVEQHDDVGPGMGRPGEPRRLRAAVLDEQRPQPLLV
jgi:hypothetical protein